MTDKKVLIIEDDSDVLEILGDIIQRHFRIVKKVDSADNAYKALSEFVPDFIIADIKMPGMSGVDFVERIRSEGYSAPVLICSAAATVFELKRALVLGVVDFIEKPFTVETVETVIFRMIEIQAKKEKIQQLTKERGPDCPEVKKLLRQISLHQAASSYRLAR